MRLLLMLVLLTASQFAQAAEPIGRVFYTPEQRAQLDSLRSRRAVATQVRNEPVPEFVTYNGIVRRSDGKTTVWVNGEPLTETGLQDKQSIVGRIDRGGQILLQTPQATGEGAVRLKVGQSAELLSGQVDETFATQKTDPAAREKTKPAAEAKTKPAAPSDAKDIPPDVLEALREATRNKSGANDTVESPRPAPRP